MPCNDQRVRVLVEETEIPTVNKGVRTEVSSDAQKSGADITRLSEVYFPLEWKGEDIVSSIQSFDPNSMSNYDRVTIEWQDVRNPSNWTKVHRGYVRGVSGSGRKDSIGVGRMIVSDPATLMSAIPFSKKYKRPSVTEIFNDVADVFNESTVFNAQVAGPPSRDVDTGDPVEGFFSDISFGFLGEGTNLDDVVDFKGNRHSCADALNWATDTSGGKWYFEFGGGGGFTLNLVYDDGSQRATFVQRQNRGAPQAQTLNNEGAFPECALSEVDVISNDALAEIFPINTLTVKGATGTSIHGFETSMTPAKKAPFVTVRSPRLVQQAGGNVVGDQIETQNVTIESATNTAIKKLEQRILDSGTGTMECYGNGNPKPYDLIVARPECADALTLRVPTLPYQISGVTHTKEAQKEMITHLDVSPVVSPSNFEVVSAEMRAV